MYDDVGVYHEAEFAKNPEHRCSVVMILDTSGSMRDEKIATVNRGLQQFDEDIKSNNLTALRADIAVIEFDHEARVVQDFVNGTEFVPPTLTPKGGTNFSQAIELGLNLTQARKQSYRDGGVAYYRSLVYFLTDGYPQESTDEIANISRRLRDEEEGRHIAFLCFGISTPGEPAAMDTLNAMAPRGAVELTNMDQLAGSLEWLSQSVAAVSQSQPGEGLNLPTPNFLKF